jgi:hypothetical protein
MAKILVREEPYEESEEFPWDEGSQKRFHFDTEDLIKLDTGGIVWRGNTAFSLQDPDEEIDID